MAITVPVKTHVVIDGDFCGCSCPFLVTMRAGERFEIVGCGLYLASLHKERNYMAHRCGKCLEDAPSKLMPPSPLEEYVKGISSKCMDVVMGRADTGDKR